ncbi:site-2 protease family protein [bacterium]|nr:site-2 protease family protein [bacterium]
MDIIITILLLILVLGVLVFIHELGHFLAARIVGATVYEFALGYGPKLISKKYKGTLYSIRLLPLGGFVKILGDGDPGKKGEEELREKDIEGDLKNKSKPAQIFVMLAGVSMNILLAIVAYFVVLGFSNWKIDLSYEFEDFKPLGATIVRERDMDVPYQVLEDSLAESSGMPKEGYIKSINNEYVEYVEDISRLIEGNETVLVETCDMEEICNEYIVSVGDDGKIGIAIGSNYYISVDYSEHKALSGVSHLINNVRLIGRVFGGLFEEARETGDYSSLSGSVAGPVGMFFLIDYFKDLGWVPFIALVADLSLSLAFMNLLPIPALDGGRVFILVVEGVLRKDLDPKVEAIIINLSFILLMVFIVIVMIKDIANINELKSLFE